jgi:hypothetical protein
MAGGESNILGPAGAYSSDDALNNIIQSAMAGGGSAAMQSPFASQLSGQQVYLGGGSAISQQQLQQMALSNPSLQGQTGPMYSGGAYQEYDDAILAPLNWSDDERRQFVNQGVLNKAPGFNVNMGMPEIQAAWQALVDTSMLYNSRLKAGEQRWTPQDVLGTYENAAGRYGEVREGDWVYDVATGERIRYVGPKSKTVTSKNIDLSSPEDVNALVLQSLRELLGRAPTDKELAQFRGTINNLERSRPQVTTTVQQLSPNKETGEVSVTSEESTTTGGVSDTARAMLVQEDVLGTKEYAKYQGGTTYFNAMMAMLSGS